MKYEDEMGRETLILIVLLVLLTFPRALAQEPGKSVPSASPAWNDNSLIAVQKRGETPLDQAT
jgi:hypothetical protein